MRDVFFSSGPRPRSGPGIRSPQEPGDPGRRIDLLLGHGGDQSGEWRAARARHRDQRGAPHLRKLEAAARGGGLVAPAARQSSASGFAVDSLQEEAGFEPSVPRECLVPSFIVHADFSASADRGQTASSTAGAWKTSGSTDNPAGRPSRDAVKAPDTAWDANNFDCCDSARSEDSGLQTAFRSIPAPRGTDSSNSLPSRGESVANRFGTRELSGRAARSHGARSASCCV